LEGLPVPQHTANPQPLNQNTLWLILAILIMLAIVIVTWFVYRHSHRRTASTRNQTAQILRWGVLAVDARREPLDRPSSANVSPSQKDQQETLLQELLHLDKAYESGRIKKPEYEQQRAITKTQLRSLMSKDVVEQPAPIKKTAKSSGKGTT
jgi:hypothetical protein